MILKKTAILNFEKIAIVSHDAGAANLILGWIKEHHEIKQYKDPMKRRLLSWAR